MRCRIFAHLNAISKNVHSVVPCLVGLGKRVVLDWYWLDHDWSDDRPTRKDRTLKSASIS
jgi:hypothetical protein